MSKQAADLASDAANASILIDEGEGRSSRSKKEQKMEHLDSEKGCQHVMIAVNDSQKFQSDDEMNMMGVGEDRNPRNQSKESPSITSSDDSILESDLIRDFRSKLRQKERHISELKKHTIRKCKINGDQRLKGCNSREASQIFALTPESG
ncbi:unnamed protein product [Allacma fusca]|uniref:Uncharacterized protein n=1 Tax=Allacma fusca TaxID=39272 RepID=A0A8J2K860_9HEXA|nr:unnamed protein product [Allacma fusca]